MKIKSLKRLLWVLNTFLVIGLVLVALKFFILEGKQRRQARAAVEILGKGRFPEGTRAADMRRTEPLTTYSVIYDLHITGLPPVNVEIEDPDVVETHVAALAREYDLLWTKEDPDPLRSFAHLAKKETEGKRIDLRVGEMVEGWTLVAVRAEAYEADFKEETSGERVTLKQKRKPLPKDGGAESGPGPHHLPPDSPVDGPPPREGPTRGAIEVRENEWEMPREEATWWSHWGEEEAGKIAVEPRVNPETGEPDGVRIRKIAPGSMPQRRGLMPGDVLKSINGVPMNTKADAIAYVKGPGKGLKRYRVVVERKGRDITMVYNVRQ